VTIDAACTPNTFKVAVNLLYEIKKGKLLAKKGGSLLHKEVIYLYSKIKNN